MKDLNYVTTVELGYNELFGTGKKVRSNREDLRYFLSSGAQIGRIHYKRESIGYNYDRYSDQIRLY